MDRVDKAVTKANKQAKIDSRLSEVDRTARQNGRAAGAAAGRRAGIKVVGDRIDIVVEAADGSAVDAVTTAGGTVEGRYRGLVQALVPADAVSRLAESPSVRYVRPPIRLLDESGRLLTETPASGGRTGAAASGTTSEGVSTTNASAWHVLGRTGAGAKVAQIGFSFDGVEPAQASGDLPSSLAKVNYGCPGNPFDAGPGTTGVKRAEVTYQMAPDAELTLICVDISTEPAMVASFAQAVTYLEANDIKLAYTAVGIVGEGRGDGVAGNPFAAALAEGAANGILWIAPTFGLAQTHWAGAFADSNGDRWHEFASGNNWGNWFYVPPGNVPCVEMTWDSWPMTSQDFDLYIFDENGNLTAASTTLQNGSQQPHELACGGDPSPGRWYFAAIYKFAATAKPRMDLWFYAGTPIYSTSAGTVIDPATSTLVLGVGAACWQTNVIEASSGRGPTIDGRRKPDLAGPASVSTPAGVASSGCDTGFRGSTAAAAHVAGAAALVAGFQPSWTAAQIRTFLTANAKDLGAAGPDNTYGSGRLWLPVAPPAVSGFSPAAGPIGTTVTVSGSLLAGATAVKFNGVAATPTNVTPTSLKAVVPDGATSGQVQVVTPDGVGTSVGAFKVTPKVTGFSPSAGLRGSPVEISGASFTGATKVLFDSVVSSFTVDSDSKITAVVPSTAVSAKVTVTTPSGSGASASSFVVILPPVISSFSPASGPVGATVTVSGSNLDGVSSGTLNGTDVGTLTKVGTTQLKFNVPAGATNGKLALTNVAGTALSAAIFKVTPKVVGYSPVGAAALASVAITGTSLSGATSVKFNGLAAPVLAGSDDTTIQTTVPAAAVTGPVSVTTPGGTATGPTFKVLPVIASLSVTSGPVGTVATISGTTFNGVSSVKFNGVAAPFTFVSAATVKATVPSAATSGPVTLTTPGGTAASPDSFAVTPKITSFTPASGPVGTIVTVSGSGFFGSPTVRFNGTTAATVTNVTATSVKATVPPGASTGKIEVTTSDGSALSVANFVLTPKVAGFVPAAAARGTSVEIDGWNFAGATKVLFGAVASSFTVDSDTKITAVVPPTAVSTKVTVTTPAGSGLSALNFLVILPPTVSALSPVSGPVGTLVSVSGSNLDSVGSASLNGVNVGTLTHVGSTLVKFTVPSGASTGKVAVTNPGGTGQSAGNFVVTPKVLGYSPSGSAPANASVTITGTGLSGATSVKFNGVAAAIVGTGDTTIDTVVPPTAVTGPVSVTTPSGTTTGPVFKVLPVISSLSVTSGPSGTVVAINGSTFNGVSSVKFNGVAAAFSSVAPTSLKATVPPTATSGPVTVTTPGGTATSADTFAVTPKVTSFVPTSGPVGTVVTVTGSGFFGTPTVKFNGVAATTVTNVTPTSLKVTVPPGAMPGPLTVMTTDGSGSSAASFGVTFSVASFAPGSGSLGTTVNLTGIGFLKVTAVKVGNAFASFLPSSDTAMSVTIPPGATTGPIVLSNGAISVPTATSFTVLAPPPGQLVFERGTPSTKQIWKVNPDGSGLTQLTSGGFMDQEAAWSPDGSKIAFISSNRGGCCNTDVYVMNADGTAITRPTTEADFDGEPAWSPDGSKIAFASEASGALNVWVMSPDGTSKAQLTTGAGANARPDWSPDGSKIAFTSFRDGQAQIYVMNADGTAQTRLSNNSYLDDDPAWSPGGSKIAFTSFRDGNDEIYLMNADGTSQTRLTVNTDPDELPVWSPDGSKIAFQSARSGSYAIWVMNPDGSSPIRLTTSTDGEARPDW